MFFFLPQRNPFIKIYGLPWSFPGWLNPYGQRNPYMYANITSQYVIKWIKAASRIYDVDVDYIGVRNNA